MNAMTRMASEKPCLWSVLTPLNGIFRPDTWLENGTLTYPLHTHKKLFTTHYVVLLENFWSGLLMQATQILCFNAQIPGFW